MSECFDGEMTAEQFPAEAQWRYSKTMPHIPHEYTIFSEQEKLTLAQCHTFCQHIYDNGFLRKWFKAKHCYQVIGDYIYWTMRDFNKPDDGMEVRTLVNRTFHSKERVQAVKDFVTSPNYTWERGDTLEIIEARRGLKL